ncbi:response regulator [Synoicihabitans lomoniglobus]|uniref:response regulator n=1 Tax=Synoicihabitans lomoniglobus TaxID=2909285 RepID=UPI002ED59086|nr:response regulator [Opitutaceae bacterium LMO-M01]
MSGLVVLAMIVPLLGWIFEIPSFIELRAFSEPIKANTVIATLLIGIALVGVEMGNRRMAWFGLVPTIIGALTFLQDATGQSFSIDELLFTYFISDASPAPGRMTEPISISLMLSGLVVTSLVVPRIRQRHTLVIALVASAVISLGAATLMGYALDLNAVYLWGFDTATSPLAAIALSLTGIAILARAWREHTLTDSGAPTWLPLPVVVGSATLTLILYLGLQEQEIVRLHEATRRSASNLISALQTKIRSQSDELWRFDRDWSDPNKTAVVRGIEAETSLNVNPSGQVYSLVSPGENRVTLEVYPSVGNEFMTGFDHGKDPVRMAAMQRALLPPRGPAVSGSIDIPQAGLGYAIYVPLERNNELWGFLAGEFLYDRLIGQIINEDESLRSDYLTRVSITEVPIFDNTGILGPLDDIVQERGGIDFTQDIYDRRIRFSLVRTAEAFQRDRRNLPELAFASGLIVTLLLGVSVHLARTANTLLRSAEISNTRLVAENEERRRVEAMLKVSDERLRLALDSTQIGIFEWSLPSNQMYYSPGLWNMLDYAPGEIANTPEAWTALIHEDDLPGYRSAVERQLSGDETFISPEYRLRTGKGEWRWIYARAKTVARAPSGAPQRIIGTLQDINERKAAEAALRESQAAARKLSLVAARTDNLVMISAPNGTIEWVNESFTRVMEYDLAEIRGRTPDTFLSGPDTHPRTLRRIRAALAKGVGVTTDLVNYSKSGRKFHVHLEVQPVRNEHGQLETFIAILADITTRVETETALRRAKADADNASRAKSEFLASMSHEIRTPMNGVIGMTSLLMDTRLDPEQRDFVNTIRTSGEALLTIINDILDFSKIESGKMELEHLPFDLPTTIEEALDLFAMQASGKHLDLAYHVADDVPAWVMGDITRLRQILVNLVNNAVKFTASGSITILVRRKLMPLQTTDDNQVLLEFTVRDSGIGIPQERIDRLFKPFSQVDSSTTRKFGGTGLGLAICHRLTQLMGGGIHVESTLGEGSRFIFTMRTAAAHPLNAEPLPPVPKSLVAGTVLGVEDNDVGQRRLQSFFKQWKLDYAGADNIASALSQLQAEKRPSLVLLDDDLLSQPGGTELLTLVATHQIPTLLLLTPGRDNTFKTQTDTRLLTLKKPLKTSTLLRGVHSLFRKRGEAEEPETEVPKRKILAEELPLDVLLVEDNTVNQKVALRFLDRLGYRADAVGNGLEAVAAVESRRFDLVLMDLQMPEMDGFEASREIRRKFPAEHQPKIIALTANALQGDREDCLAAGMDDYITKPVKLHELSEVIRRQFVAKTEDPVPFSGT